MEAWLLGSGGWMPSDERETACCLVRDGPRALLLDAGTGARRLVGDRSLLEGVRRLDVVLTHFHLDHVCGLVYLEALDLPVSVWGPGTWLYRRTTAAVLGELLRPPVAPSDLHARYELHELRGGRQEIGRFEVRTSEQPRHWAPSAGLRVGDELALVTDTPYDDSSVRLAEGVERLLHEAWSSSREPHNPEHDATAADAARAAARAGAGALTLVHLNPLLRDLGPVLEDARAGFERVELGEDLMRVL